MRKGNAHTKLEVFKLRRQVKSMQGGKHACESSPRSIFAWCGRQTNGRRMRRLESTALGYAGSFADMPTPEKQTGQLSFTLFWTEENRWEGRNFEVAIE